MKLQYLVLLLFSLTIACSTSNEKLIWEENFDGSALNESIWNYELGDGCPNLCGWGNNEAQHYTKNNHKVTDGFLTITTKKEDSIYTSTRITTKDKFEFTYGRVEIRAKLPVGKGLWPALWMLGADITEVGWPKCGEIDILEYIGRDPNHAFFSLHTEDSHGNTINSKRTKIENIEKGFHIYEMEWTAESISFYVDGKHQYTFSPKDKTEAIWPYNKDFYFIINTAVGGNFGGQDIDGTIFPQDFVIDYIKVFQ